MRIIFHPKSLYILGAVVLGVPFFYFLVHSFTGEDLDHLTTTVERGTVSEFVSVSGIVEAKNTAELSFPVSGVIDKVLVEEGDTAEEGEVLLTLSLTQLSSERLEAVSALEQALADRDKLIAGPRKEERTVTDTTVTNAEENLKQVILEENEKVENAYRTLLSSGLEAYSSSTKDENATPPTITGTYSCDTEGAYKLKVYASGALSGYSFSLSGLESGIYTAYEDSPNAFGSCGLFIQFDEDSTYGNSVWEIAIPNTRSSVYQTNLNAYNLAIQQQEKAIEAAENALTLALDQSEVSNASPRSEERRKADATVSQMRARLGVIDAMISDRILTAPFSGTVTAVEKISGEAAGTLPIVTMVANDAFDLIVRIPEIDIAKITTNQKAQVVFDARDDQTVMATITYVSPLAIEIDGVGYFEAKLAFENTPDWVRGGMNADVEIISKESSDTLRIPRRFLSGTEGSYSVLVRNGNQIASTSVTVGLMGNDGYVEIIGLNQGDTVVAP